jgi:hypothetical protein
MSQHCWQVTGGHFIPVTAKCTGQLLQDSTAKQSKAQHDTAYDSMQGQSL